MAITTFDTHKFVRRLEQAGVPLEQAEVQAEVLTEAFNVNLESLVTKDYLAARFAEHDATIDSRFAQFEARMEANFRILRWMIGIVTAAVLVPLIQQISIF